jgi:hypothetical protein
MQCQWLNDQGEQCRAAALIDGQYCFQHSPAVAEERHEARSRGGRNRAAPKNIDFVADFGTIKATRVFLESVADAVLRGDLDSGRAKVCIQAAQAARGLSDEALEKRVRDLEKLMAKREGLRGTTETYRPGSGTGSEIATAA